MSGDWINDSDLDAMKMESNVFGKGLGSQTNGQISQRLLDENVVGATMSIIHIARHGQNERLRFQAAKYVVDRGLGPIAAMTSPGVKDPLEKLMEEFLDK